MSDIFAFGFWKYFSRTVNDNLWKSDQHVSKVCVFISEFSKFVIIKLIHGGICIFIAWRIFDQVMLMIHITKITHFGFYFWIKIAYNKEIIIFWHLNILCLSWNILIICNITFMWVIERTYKDFFFYEDLIR